MEFARLAKPSIGPGRFPEQTFGQTPGLSAVVTSSYRTISRNALLLQVISYIVTRDPGRKGYMTVELDYGSRVALW